MRDVFRNREFRSFFLLLLAIGAVGAAVGLSVSLPTGLLVMAICALFSTLLVLFTRSRYRRIARLTEQIDQVLHGNETLAIGDFSEGELSILEAEVQKMTIRLREQADNLQRDKQHLSDSIADIAHQIRTPITSIGIINAMLARDGLGSARRAELARELETLLLRVDWLVTTLLKISRIDASTVEFHVASYPLADLIDKSLEPFSLQLELKNITVEKTVSGEIRCDIGWTAEALGNILKNCIEYVDGSGDGVICIEASQNRIYSEIVVSDNGPGFSAEDLPRLFERFYKGSGGGGGASGFGGFGGFGIGLALARMIVSEQNGTLKAENNEPRGARFVARFY